MTDVVYSARGLRKSFALGSGQIEILKGLELDILRGESLSIMGSSGAGKSTLLHILGTLDAPTQGSLTYEGQELTQLSADSAAELRNKKMGFVFQFHHLLAEFSALENVSMPLRLQGVAKPEALEKAHELLKTVGLAERESHFPAQLSGGELQRVAVARALVNGPVLLFADEPTGNLDSYHARLVQDLLLEMKEKLKVTLIVVTHDSQFAQRFQRSLRLRDGVWSENSF